MDGYNLLITIILMLKIKRIQIAAVFLLSTSLTAFTQTEVTDTLTCRLYFRQGQSALDVAYRNNGLVFSQFVDSVNALVDNPAMRMVGVIVEGSSSPEGSAAVNDALALRRARSLRSSLIDKSHIDPDLVRAYSVGIDWSRLAGMLRQSDFNNREQLASIIADNADRSSSEIIRQLKKADGGRSWRRMLADLFPDLRQSSATLTCYYRKVTMPVASSLVVVRDTVYLRDTMTVASQPKMQVIAMSTDPSASNRKVVAALRTNLLIPLLNLGLEVPLGNRWSVGGDCYFPWLWRQWHPSTEMKHCQELFSAGVDVRYWLGGLHSGGQQNWRYRLTGHSVGVYGYYGYFDFGRNYSGQQGEYTNVGVDYQFAKAVGRRGRLRFEFSLGIGWIHSSVQKYNVYSEGGHAYRTGNRRNINWFGPTKATISLVIPFMNKIKKEGRQ